MLLLDALFVYALHLTQLYSCSIDSNLWKGPSTTSKISFEDGMFLEQVVSICLPEEACDKDICIASTSDFEDKENIHGVLHQVKHLW